MPTPHKIASVQPRRDRQHPTTWRCACGRLETLASRCGLITPWEAGEAQLRAECQQLVAAHREEMKAESRERVLRFRRIPAEAHGRPTGYQHWKCRCAKCREWNTLTMRSLRHEAR